ncbi:hypothetical protein CC80DRAFT_542359 [Byssothecium circinans]|uniref:Uncharacterized protein n=1 Tax=Byssothecium circinans TaxID=147558 RepID=A0A6A5UJW9_9PLEO|nr:hypothetical protein CC80DRAFT_542359 [Byssothecium circinans]
MSAAAPLLGYRGSTSAYKNEDQASNYCAIQGGIFAAPREACEDVSMDESRRSGVVSDPNANNIAIVRKLDATFAWRNEAIECGRKSIVVCAIDSRLPDGINITELLCDAF